MSCMGHNFFTICIWQNAKFRLMQTGGVHGGVNRVGEGADYGEWDPTATVQMVARELARYRLCIPQRNTHQHQNRNI